MPANPKSSFSLTGVYLRSCRAKVRLQRLQRCWSWPISVPRAAAPAAIVYREQTRHQQAVRERPKHVVGLDAHKGLGRDRVGFRGRVLRNNPFSALPTRPTSHGPLSPARRPWACSSLGSVERASCRSRDFRTRATCTLCTRRASGTALRMLAHAHHRQWQRPQAEGAQPAAVCTVAHTPLRWVEPQSFCRAACSAVLCSG